MLQDGPKKIGRFIKKGSKVLDKVSMSEFSFQEICSTDVVSHDNQSRSIIHSKYHDVAHIDRNVKTPVKFDDDLQNENVRRPILFPLDFTRDWERDKKLRKSRIARQGDDDEIDFDLEEAEASMRADSDEEAADGEEENKSKGFTPTVGGEVIKKSTPAPATTGQAATNTSAKPAAASTGNLNAGQGETLRYDSMDVVGKAIKNLMHHDDDHPANETLKATPLKTSPAAPSVLMTNNSTNENQPAPQTAANQRSDDFIPVNASATGQPASMDPEAEAARLYQQRQVEEKLIEERVAAAVEEAKARGYRDGYILGEEKAELQARQKTASMFGKVGELIQEFSHLKLEILNNVQENFYELSQAMGEALLKREFSIKPETFATVLRRAISESIAPGEFKIRVNPEMYDRITTLGDETLAKTLVKDQDIALGDFKIESDLSVVDGQVGKLIKDLLEQADLNIFGPDADKDADKDDKKAG